jgi:hypothetical protein
MRIAAAVHEGEANILLTDYLTPNSRMMIRRKVRTAAAGARGIPRVGHRSLPGDHRRRPPGLDGRRLHHVRRASLLARVDVGDIGRVNYIRNAVKATVDAYDGATRLYVFAPDDPIIAAYQHLFPDLFLPASADAAPTCAPTPAIRRRSSACRRDLPHVPHARSAVVL